MKMRKRKQFRRRMRSMGGIGGMNLDFSGIFGAAAGGFTAKIVNKFVPATLDTKIVSGGKIVLGALLPMLIKGRGNELAKAAGYGMIAVGATELLSSLGVMAGLGADDETLAVALEGIDDVDFLDLTEKVSGDESVLAGDESVLAGDDIPVINGDDIPVINGDDYDY